MTVTVRPDKLNKTLGEWKSRDKEDFDKEAEKQESRLGWLGAKSGKAAKELLKMMKEAKQLGASVKPFFGESKAQVGLQFEAVLKGLRGSAPVTGSLEIAVLLDWNMNSRDSMM